MAQNTDTHNKTQCSVLFLQQLFGIHLADQVENCTMQLADHIKVRYTHTLSCQFRLSAPLY